MMGNKITQNHTKSKWVLKSRSKDWFSPQRVGFPPYNMEKNHFSCQMDQNDFFFGSIDMKNGFDVLLSVKCKIAKKSCCMKNEVFPPYYTEKNHFWWWWSKSLFWKETFFIFFCIIRASEKQWRLRKSWSDPQTDNCSFWLVIQPPVVHTC